ncbi:D-alanyl-lipoteichoic acid biosynthesis protein DltD [Gottfriedia luciferensis]|uniref:D-alanyl-lipoteichoic acid biosynthesis protein DltD n=1 Tax=Gottfriedia luciferensis TaxID=178774 RepID=UPI000B447A2B|nr:D-alanyl-lipoteichoic acid biosynthesis protein DltD [Gottfriedia luciferensis]
MKKPTFGPIILAFIIVILLISIPNQWISGVVNKQTANHLSNSLSTTVFQGIAVQKEVMKEPNFVPIYGSSELLRFDSFHPSNFFEKYDPKYTPFLIGRGGTQSLIHFLSLSSVYPYLKDKQIVFIVSPQWFNKRGLDEARFSPNFSKLQAIELANNNQIPIDIKKRAIHRLLDYSIVKNDHMLSTVLKNSIGEKTNQPADNIMANYLVNPYLSIVKKQDIALSKFNVGARIFNSNHYTTPENKSYSELLQMAEKQGEKTSTNNPFGIRNSIYSFHFANKINDLKNINTKVSYNVSPEYGDLQLVLDLLKSAHAKPLFIVIPVNGYFYDYTGFKKENRSNYYKKVSNEIRSSGFDIADLSSHEYEKYFFRDSLHISLKGWVYIDQAMEAFLNHKST